MDSQGLTVDLDEQDPLDGGSSVRVDDVVGGGEVLDEKGKNREELIFGELRNETTKARRRSAITSSTAERKREEWKRAHLIPESMQELDGVDEKEEVDGSFGPLKILEHVLREELDDIDKDIGGGDSVL